MTSFETRVFTHPDCLEHRPPAGFPEKPERLVRLEEHLESRFPVEHPEIDSDRVDRAVRRVHDVHYVDRLRAACRRGDGVIDSADNPLSPGTWDATIAASGCGLAALDWVRGADGGPGRHAFVGVRPPGHHATPSRAMGFCYLCHVAVVARAWLDGERPDEDPRVGRVAVVDFDVHHGNGTQEVFWRRGDVFFFSMHQFPFYPGTGRAEETGEGDGKGTTLNVPLAAGKGDDDYLRVLDETLRPALDRWKPEALVVSAGFDAWRGDPLGGMRVTAEGYAGIGRRLRAVADAHCGGRMISCLEGGYAVDEVPRLVASYLDGAALEDPR